MPRKGAARAQGASGGRRVSASIPRRRRWRRGGRQGAGEARESKLSGEGRVRRRVRWSASEAKQRRGRGASAQAPMGRFGAKRWRATTYAGCTLADEEVALDVELTHDQTGLCFDQRSHLCALFHGEARCGEELAFKQPAHGVGRGRERSAPGHFPLRKVRLSLSAAPRGRASRAASAAQRCSAADLPWASAFSPRRVPPATPPAAGGVPGGQSRLFLARGARAACCGLGRGALRAVSAVPVLAQRARGVSLARWAAKRAAGPRGTASGRRRAGQRPVAATRVGRGFFFPRPALRAGRLGALGPCALEQRARDVWAMFANGGWRVCVADD